MTKSNEPLALWQVLIEEYKAQDLSAPPPDFTEKHAQLKKRYGLEDDGGDGGRKIDEDERELIEKKINSEMVKAFYSWLHAQGAPRAALCFSGGGIRSATYGLGVLQGLARHGLLDKFHFLSTVSGGGYLGGWLSAWVHRRGLDGVVERLRNPPRRKSPLQPEAEPVKHLRSYSNYMSPKVGLLSADTWTLAAIYLRNLLLNWLVLVPLLMAALIIPRVFVWLVALPGKANDVDFVAGSGPWVFLFGVLLGIVAIAYIYANRPSLSVDRKAGGASRLRLTLPPGLRSQKWFLWLCLLPFVVLTLSSVLVYAWLPVIRLEEWSPSFLLPWVSEWPRYGAKTGWPPKMLYILFGVTLQVGGFLLALLFMRRADPTAPRRLLGYLVEFLIALGGGVASGLLTWLIATEVFPHPAAGAGEEVRAAWAAFFACFAPPLFLLLVLAAFTIFIGLTSRVLTDADREWLARTGGWVLIVCAAWIVVSAIVIYGPVVLAHPSVGLKLKTALASASVLSGLVTLILGRSSSSPASDKEAAKGGVTSMLAGTGLTVAAAVFTASILTLLSLATGFLVMKAADWFSLPHPWSASPETSVYAPFTQEGMLALLYLSPGRVLAGLALTFIAVSLVMALTININKFSLHGAYRDRLVRAYLGASRSSRERKPNPFTGLDEQDNVQMQELRTQLFYAEGINDLPSLATTLLGGDSPAAKFVGARLSEDTRALLKPYASDAPPADPVRADDVKGALAFDLNRLIQGPPLHEEPAFQGHKGEVAELIPGAGDDAVEALRLNRRLLEAAFLNEFAPARPCMPLHVVNIALNLVGGRDLAWQNRKAESFTVSPLHAGSYCVGYRDARAYGGGRGISLGTAVAVSGAAASPNMGYHSSPLVTFLLTLFNVRLGWWLGNPGRAGAHTFNRPGPVLAFRPIIAEMLGLTDDRNRYVYLSDGGHFENLGLYEMVLRRCRFIVVSDGSADPTYNFEGLGNAISKVRVDLGVPIKFDRVFIFPQGHQLDKDRGEERAYCAIGRVCYSCVDQPAAGGAPVADGLLLYVKATLTGGESKDIYNYARAHKDFPHESTGDQMYSEEQFESYRELGSHGFEQIWSKLFPQAVEAESIEQFMAQAEKQFGPAPGCS